jgi:hypothetical protein
MEVEDASEPKLSSEGSCRPTWILATCTLVFAALQDLFWFQSGHSSTGRGDDTFLFGMLRVGPRTSYMTSASGSKQMALSASFYVSFFHHSANFCFVDACSAVRDLEFVLAVVRYGKAEKGLSSLNL